MALYSFCVYAKRLFLLLGSGSSAVGDLVISSTSRL